MGQQAFERIKTYLANPPILVPPVPSPPLLLYLGNVDGMCLGAEAMIGIVRLAFPLDLGLGWYIRVGTVSRVCVILVFEYTVIKKSRQQE